MLLADHLNDKTFPFNIQTDISSNFNGSVKAIWDFQHMVQHRCFMTDFRNFKNTYDYLIGEYNKSLAHPKDQGLIKLLRIEKIRYALKNQIKPIQQQQTIESITTIRNEILIHNT